MRNFSLTFSFTYRSWGVGDTCAGNYIILRYVHQKLLQWLISCWLILWCFYRFQTNLLIMERSKFRWSSWNYFFIHYLMICQRQTYKDSKRVLESLYWVTTPVYTCIHSPTCRTTQTVPYTTPSVNVQPLLTKYTVQSQNHILFNFLADFMVAYHVKKQMNLCQRLMAVILCVRVRGHLVVIRWRWGKCLSILQPD